MNTERSIRGGAMVLVVALLLLTGCGRDTPEALVSSAKEYLAKSDRNAAVIQLKNALQKNPDLAEARFLLGKASLDAGDVAAAEKELRKARELGYPGDQVDPLLARALVCAGRLQNGDRRVCKGRGHVSGEQGRTANRVERGACGYGPTSTRLELRIAAALAAVPGYPPALIGEARLKAGTGDLPAAMAQVETALVAAPTLTDGWQLKGDILNAQGQFDEALAAYRKAIESTAHLPARHIRSSS